VEGAQTSCRGEETGPAPKGFGKRSLGENGLKAYRSDAEKKLDQKLQTTKKEKFARAEKMS